MTSRVLSGGVSHTRPGRDGGTVVGLSTGEEKGFSVCSPSGGTLFFGRKNFSTDRKKMSKEGYYKSLGSSGRLGSKDGTFRK